MNMIIMVWFLCVCLCVCLVSQCQQKFIADPDQLMSVALECIYSCEREDQLALSYDILECLPQRGYGLVCITTHTQHTDMWGLLSQAELLLNFQCINENIFNEQLLSDKFTCFSFTDIFRNGYCLDYSFFVWLSRTNFFF